MKEIERLKIFSMKPPLFAEQLLEDLQRELLELRMNITPEWHIKRPKDTTLIEITKRKINELQKEIFIDSL